MNIFKVLANGDGTLNEANISAFLGYLLDPYQDHGLGHEFLKRIIQKIEFQISDNFNIYKYEYEVILEQAFRDEDKELKKKEIVDIVILCFETNKGNYKELIAKNSIEKVRILKYIILIENKVKVGAKTESQLKNQYENSLKSLNIDNSKIITIYVTPDDKKYIEEFKNFTNNDKKLHLVWISENEKLKLEDVENIDVEKLTSIFEILKSIISEETNGNIDALNEYTKHTLISFLKFIENDFKSQKREDKEIKEDRIYNGDYTQKYIDINSSTNILEKLTTLRNELVKRNIEFKDKLSKPNLSKPRFPFLSYECGPIDIQIGAGSISRDKVALNYRSNSRDINSYKELEKISDKLSIEIKKKEYKKDAYCRTFKMKQQLKIDDFDGIYNQLINTINQTKSI
jgi:hypothetical protein